MRLLLELLLHGQTIKKANVQSHGLGCVGLLYHIRDKQTSISGTQTGAQSSSATQDTSRGVSTQAAVCTGGTNTRQQCLSTQG